jgi:cysteine desulfurase / selenocysteine lyase
MSVAMKKNDQQILWRDDFPIFANKMNNKDFIYFDTASSAQKPNAVLNAIQAAYTNHYANVHRGLYQYSQQQTALFEAVRDKVKKFIGAPDSYAVVFTRNTTEAINLVAQCWGRTYLHQGDEVILSALEHHANIVPWQMLQNKIGFDIKVVPLNDSGHIDLETLKSLLGSKTKLVALNHISNAIGSILDVERVRAMMDEHAPQAKFLVDGSQSVPHMKLNLAHFAPDFFVFTGHKLYGPNGVGCLVAPVELLNALPPYQGGGDMIERVSFTGTTFQNAPARFEAGTPVIAEVIALGAAIDYLTSIGMEVVEACEKDLLAYLLEGLKNIDGLSIIGPQGVEGRAGIISFVMNNAHPSDIAMVLDQMGIAVRTGHHCCMPLMESLGVEGTVRVSLGIYNTKDDIDLLCEALKKVARMFA